MSRAHNKRVTWRRGGGGGKVFHSAFFIFNVATVPPNFTPRLAATGNAANCPSALINHSGQNPALTGNVERSRLAAAIGQTIMNGYHSMKTTKLFFATLILTFGVLFHLQAQDPLTNRLVAYYPFNGNGNDQSGNGNHSTPAGNFTFVTNGLSGGALQIIGDNSIYYSGGGHALLPTFSSSMNTGFTFSAWAKIGFIGGNPFPFGAIIAFGAQSSPLAEIHLNKYTATPYLLYYMNSGGPGGPNVEFRQNVDSQTIATSWTHVVMTYVPGKIAAYLNGQKVGETNYTFNVFPVTKAAIGRQWFDGGASSSAKMDAVIDNVRIYNRALASTEVQALYSYELNPLPRLTIAVKTVRVDMYVETGRTYQVQSSSDLNTWNPVGIPFVAAASKYSSDFDVLNGQQFFRIMEIVP